MLAAVRRVPAASVVTVMFDRFESDDHRQRFVDLWDLSAAQMESEPGGQFLRTRFEACEHARYVGVVAKSESAEWPYFVERCEALIDQVQAVIGRRTRVIGSSFREDSLELGKMLVLGVASDQESLGWSDAQEENADPADWPPLATLERMLLGGVSFGFMIAGFDVDAVFSEIPALAPMLELFDEYSVEVISGVLGWSPTTRMSGHLHGSRLRRGPVGWVPDNLGVRMKFKDERPWMGGPNRRLLERFYDIESKDGSVYLRALEHDRVPSAADWVALDRYDNAPPEVRSRFHHRTFIWPVPEYKVEFPEGFHVDQYPEGTFDLKRRFPVEYQDVVGETLLVSLVCDGPSLRLQEAVESWFGFVLSGDPPRLSCAGDGKWIDTDEDGVWVYQFTCDLGDSGELEWLERLFWQLDERELQRVTISDRL